EEEWRFNGDVPGSTHSSSCQIITLLSDTCTLRTPHTEVQLALGDTVVLPASLGTYTLSGQSVRLVLSYVPTEDDPTLVTWRAAQPVAHFE
ncbi:MAG TPA: hypothetical protein VF510_03520, partial [Ktedonobacterales bacterium]